MIKRRNFLKMLPVGFLAAKFGGLVEILKPDVYPRSGKPFTFVCDLVLPTKPTWATVEAPIMITSREHAEELFSKGSELSRCFPEQPEPITVTYV